jgi:hypothetical protein
VVGLVVVFTVVAMYLPELPFFKGVVLKSLYCLVFVGLLVLGQVVDKREWLALASLLPRRTKPLLT